jgi:peptide subunit release factor RF-3
MGKQKTKRDLYLHFKKRMKERYNLDINNNDIELINGWIKTNNKRILDRQSQSNSRTLFDILYQENIIRVAYNKNLGCVTTVLPKIVLNNKLN